MAINISFRFIMLQVIILLCYLGIAKCEERIPFLATTAQKESKIKLLNRVSLKEGEELKKLLNHWPGLAFLCTMKSVKCPDEEAVSYPLGFRRFSVILNFILNEQKIVHGELNVVSVYNLCTVRRL
jgi:hypothetical protein